MTLKKNSYISKFEKIKALLYIKFSISSLKIIFGGGEIHKFLLKMGSNLKGEKTKKENFKF